MGLPVACLLGLLGPAAAVTAAEPAPEPAFSLTVSPTRLVVPPDQIDTEHGFRVTNRGRFPIDVTVEKRSFTATEDGTLRFQAAAPYSASNWVTVTPPRFRLAPGSDQAVSVHIAVPAPPAPAPEPGDHQVALVFLVPAGKHGPNIRINRGIGTPVYVTVPGPADDSTEVTGLTAPGFVLGGPVVFTARVTDTGTMHRDFRGRGRLAVRVGGTDVPFPDFTVPRGSTRQVTATWHPPLVCVCRATVSVAGPGGTAAGATTRSVRVVVLPLHLFGIVVIAVAGLSLLVLLARRRYRAQVVAAAAALRSAEAAAEAAAPRSAEASQAASGGDA